MSGVLSTTVFFIKKNVISDAVPKRLPNVPYSHYTYCTTL